MQTSHCPACGSAIAGSNINVQTMVAVCTACDTVHPLADTLSVPSQRPVATADPALKLPVDDQGGTPPEALMRMSGGPPGLSVHVKDEVLSIQRRWWAWSPTNLFMLFFCLVWDGFLVVWYAGTGAAVLGALSSDTPAAAAALLLPLLFPILHLAAGAHITYSMACQLLNRTTLKINDKQLLVDHGPLPAGAVEPIAVSAIEQVFVTEVEPKKGKSRNLTSWKFRPSGGQFNVVARCGHRKNRVIFEGLSDGEHAVYIERRIEAFLGIENVPIDGEWQG